MGITSIMLTYIVVAGGVIHINSSFRAFDFFHTALGSSKISLNSLAVLSIPSAIFRTKRGLLMPHVSNAFKMAIASNIKGQQLLTTMVLPTKTNWVNLSFVITGAVGTGWLYWMRNQFVWWPFHPIGFIASPGEFALNNLWFSIFMGWTLKKILLGVGGLKTFQKSKPFFVGLVLGDCIIGGVWAIVGLVVGEGYTMLPG